jgi:hypothetical protein
VLVGVLAALSVLPPVSSGLAVVAVVGVGAALRSPSVPAMLVGTCGTAVAGAGWVLLMLFLRQAFPGDPGLIAGTAAAVSVPVVWAWSSTWPRRQQPAGVWPGPSGHPPTSPLSALTTDELCAVWRTSTESLREGVLTVSLVSVRAQCLDELERRYPDRFPAWLDAAGVDADPADLTVDVR